MLIRIGYDIVFEMPAEIAVVALVNVHPSRVADLREPDTLILDPPSEVHCYYDTFGNRCCRFVAPAGEVRLSNSTLISDSGAPDVVSQEAREVPVQNLTHEVLRYLLNSRYCEVDRMSNISAELFGDVPPGWNRVQTVCAWI